MVMERLRHSDGKRRKQNMPSIDRLSALPDAVICQILSFLPTKLSVSTNILARRWRSLWACVPNLDFGRECFGGETQHSDIMHRFMLLHEAKNINTFRLSRVNCSEYQLETWITTAMRRNLQNLDLDFGLPVIFMLPRRLFTCKTLVDLKLGHCKLGIPATSGDVYNLPTLKKLHLYYVEYEDDEALPNLLSGCPLLEDLTIKYFFHEDDQKNLGCVRISSPAIKTLQVKFGYGSYDCPRYRMIINAPALRYLQVEDFSLARITILPITMTSLIEVDICMTEYFFADDENVNTCDVVKFLNCLCNAECLKISNCHFDEVIDVGVAGSVVKFDNLTKLELLMAVEWHLLVKFLEIADNLEVLIIDVEVRSCVEPQQVPMCLLSRLKTVRINRMGDSDHEFNMVKYLLRNAQVLETMQIFSNEDDSVLEDFEKKFDVLQKISLFERGSNACQLAFY